MTDQRAIKLIRSLVAIGAGGAVIGSTVTIAIAGFGLWWSAFGWFMVLFSVPFAVLVWWVIPQQPRNTVVWVIAAVAFGTGVHLAGMAAAAFIVRDNLHQLALVVSTAVIPAELPPSAVVILMFTEPLVNACLISALTFAFLLFPDGRLPSPGWRWVGVLSVVGVLASIAGLVWGFRPTNTAFADDQFLFRAGLTVGAVAGLLALSSLMIRFRHSSGRSREQIKWVVWGASIFVPVIVFMIFLSDTRFEGLETVLGTLAVVILIGAFGIAVGRHRLFDVDVVISRTVVVAGLAGFITIVYALLVGAVGLVVGFGVRGTLPPSIAATVVVAIAFHPLRERMRRWADRLVYGERATPYEVLSRFSAQMRDTIDIETVVPQLARLLVAGTGASQAIVWTKSNGELVPLAVWPGERQSGVAAAATDGGLSMAGVDHLAPVEHEGELLGAVTVTLPGNEELTKTEERLIDDVASQAGLVLHNARLVQELRASRQRLVTAQDEERRHLERNLHDGAQQQLIAVKLKAGLAQQFAAHGDGDRAAEMLADVLTGMDEGIESLRDLAHGIFPPLLESDGLAVALRAQAARAPIPVTVSPGAIHRYRPEIEAAVYFCVLEALQNALKYAHADSIEVTLRDQAGHLVFEVADDGQGFDGETVVKGRGLVNMTDRLDALGGALRIRSGVGEGTTVSGSIPVRVGLS